MTTTQAQTKTAADYTDARKTTTGQTKAASEYRVFIETNEGQTIIVAYKKTFRAADMLTNKIGKEHVLFSIKSWGWEIRDRFNETTW